MRKDDTDKQINTSGTAATNYNDGAAARTYETTLREPPKRLILNPEDQSIVVDPEVYASTRSFFVSFVGKEGSRYLQALEQSSRIQICSESIWGEERVIHPPTPKSIAPCQPQLLVVDWSSLDRDCHFLSSQSTDDAALPILLIDASASTKLLDCPGIFDDRIVYTAKRSVVEDRWWRFDERKINQGHLIHAGSYHIPGCVTTAITDLFSIEQKKTVDVLHYWNSVSEPTDIAARQYSSWRSTISRQIQSTQRSLQKKGHDGTWWDRFNLNDDDKDKELIQEQLFQEMVTSLGLAKIIVVTQSDEYEDHDDRLMEALASGALVMADEMLAPPAGLQNTTNVIFFDSRKSLDRLLRYYVKHESERLTIAQQGRRFAVDHHRCSHVVESVLFGTHA